MNWWVSPNGLPPKLVRVNSVTACVVPSRPFQRRATLAIFEPVDGRRLDPMVGQPALDLRALAIIFLMT